MTGQGISVTKKSGRPAKAPTSVVRLPDEVLEAADNWAKKESDKPSRPEAITRLIKIALADMPR